METYTLPLALLDFVPNFAFLTGAWFLVKLAARERSGLCAPLMTVGGLLIFLGGTLKATWKLVFTLGLADLRLLSEQQFFVSGIGFFILLNAVILLARGDRKQPHPSLLVLTPWKIPFLAVMVLSSLGAQGILSTLAFRRRIPVSGLLFVLAIICTLGMAGLSGGEQTVAKQWVQESVNTLGQSSFGLAAFLLFRRTPPPR